MRTHSKKKYHMIGCNCVKCKTKKGGSSSNMIAQPQQPLANLDLAYHTNHIPSIPNPFFAYTGTSNPLSYKGGKYKKRGGGCGCGKIMGGSSNIPTNVNGINPAIPNTGPPTIPQSWINSQRPNVGGKTRRKKRQSYKGGSCGCSSTFFGGKRRNKKFIKGGNNNGIPYPNGLVGQPWNPPIRDWPGVDGISGNHNHLDYIGKYVVNDPALQTQLVGANPPFNTNWATGWFGLKGGKKTKKMKKMYKGGVGTLSNTFGQDILNLGRQGIYGIENGYNTLQGNQAPINPLPWKGQLVGQT
jgi:hypothetical protein